ncbi:MAG: DsbA family protein [Pseudomonadales bacterium]|nr:DsbA family protein [Pseudomonadales bacterium]
MPRPGTKAPERNAGDLVLEVFPSLRSPYTAISFDRTLALAERTGIQLTVRPVMPMMMRGVPAPRAKGSYIIFDAAREAAACGVPFGNIVDPFGEPVKRAFSLYPFAAEAGAESRFVSRYLRAAWAEGVDITTDAGLRRVIEDCGLDWRKAERHLDSAAWEAVLEENVTDMLDAGLWGVPSFRVSGGGAPPFSCWGQDRLWRVEQEIAKRTTGKEVL